jgi:hypothetical protein
MSGRPLVIAASLLAISALIAACGGDHDELERPPSPLANAYRNTSIAATGDPDIPMIAVDRNGDHMAVMARDGRLVGATFSNSTGPSFTVWTGEQGRPTQARSSSPDMLFVFGNYAESRVDVGIVDTDRRVQLHKGLRVDLSMPADADNPRAAGAFDAASLADQFEWAGYVVQDAVRIVDDIYPDGVDALLFPPELIAAATSVVEASRTGIERSWEAFAAFTPALDYVTASNASPLEAVDLLLQSATEVVAEAEDALHPTQPVIADIRATFGLDANRDGGDAPGAVLFGEPSVVVRRSAGRLAFSPDGGTLALSMWPDTVMLWDVNARREIATLETPWVRVAAFSPDGSTLAIAGGLVTLWDVDTREQTTVLGFHQRSTSAVTLSPDGRMLASGGLPEGVKLWDIPSGQLIATLEGGSFSINGLAFSPDGSILAVSSYLPTTLTLWDVNSRRKIAALRGHTDTVYSAAFSPDGKTLVSASDDTTLRLWDVSTQQELATLTGHTDDVFTAVWSPDGKTLASACDDGTIRLWDVASRRAFAVLHHHRNSVFSAVLSPDGRTLASSSRDGTMRLWNVGR